MENTVRGTVASYAGSLFGASLFVISLNLIIVPHNLYSGTLTGVAQIIESALVMFAGVQIPEGSNLTGTALLLLNIPLLILALRVTSRGFLLKSIVTIVYMTIAISILPIPQEPLVTETLTACLVGGALAGFGSGFTLRCGGSGGGVDIIGVYCSVKYPNFTVGKVSFIIGAFVFSYCLIFFDLNTVIYSALFTVFYVFALDHTHYQNIKTSALIFTTNPQAIQSAVIDQLGRGATCWEGKGAYTGQHSHIFATVISRYESDRLKRMVTAADPHAFIILSNKIDVSGNFARRL
ncbi:MAG: YitT family protein [Oscillospiraceae bacterium]|nr:YitT family protein [Oscillospiraceae bacterium]